jgi:hypothetical protein
MVLAFDPVYSVAGAKYEVIRLPNAAAGSVAVASLLQVARCEPPTK